MRVLWILGELPIPADSGAKLRTLGLLKQLAPAHQVTAAILQPPKASASYLDELRSLCHEVELLPWQGRAAKAQLLMGAAANLFSSLPYGVTKYCDYETEAALAKLAAKPFDIIQCENIGFYRYLSGPPSAPKLLATQNIEAGILRQWAQLARNPLLRLYLQSQAKKMARYERRLMQKYDYVIAVSEEDASTFRDGYQAKQIAVVPNGVDTEYLQPSTEPVEEDSVIFSAALDYAPNDDAAKYFLREIWPKILQQHPPTRFLIVGKNPSRSLLSLAASCPQVEVTGWVEDMRPYLARAGVVVVPLRMGGGTRIKILEALAMGKPIVSTTIGAENLGGIAEQHFLLADTPSAFAEKTALLLKNPTTGRGLGQAARKFVETRYSWKTCASKLEETWRKACASK